MADASKWPTRRPLMCGRRPGIRSPGWAPATAGKTEVAERWLDGRLSGVTIAGLSLLIVIA